MFGLTRHHQTDLIIYKNSELYKYKNTMHHEFSIPYNIHIIFVY